MQSKVVLKIILLKTTNTRVFVRNVLYRWHRHLHNMYKQYMEKQNVEMHIYMYMKMQKIPGIFKIHF